MHNLEIAIKLALEAHQNQTDKAGHPYILHPLRVMFAVVDEGEIAQMAAVLHDTIEDTYITLEDIFKAFPNSKTGPIVASVVDHLTRREDETYHNYITRVLESPLATIVKIADIKDNLSRIYQLQSAREKTFLRARYTKTLQRLLERKFAF